MTVKKTIILLYPPYTLQQIAEIKKSLITFYPDFKIVKIITANSEYDAQALQQFIKIVSSQGESVNLIIDHKTYTSLPQNILTWCVLGTLGIAGLIRPLA